MAFDLQSGYGAGAGADMLQQIIKQKAQEAYQNQALAQEQQRIQIESQRAQQQAEYQKAVLQSAQAEKQAQEDKLAREGLGQLPAGTHLTPDLVQTAQRVGYGPLVNQQPAQPLKIVSGMGLPMGVPMVSPPKAADATFAGNAAEQERKKKETDAAAYLADPTVSPELKAAFRYEQVGGRNPPANMMAPPKPEPHSPSYTEWQDYKNSGGTLGFDAYMTRDANRKQVAPPTVVVNVPDGQGGFTQKIVPKVAGTDLGAKAPSAVTENRLVSARAVKKTGEDIIKKLQDPQVQKDLGPLLGRASSVADFVGNAPDDYKELAGLIESYSLANMGVHGMRSNTGAEAIKATLGLGKNTPSNIISTIRGLNGFAQNLIDGQPGQQAPAGAVTHRFNPATGKIEPVAPVVK